MKVIIDGNNVLCYGSDRADGKVQCYPVYIDAMFSALDAKGIEWFCFFDANCGKKVSETCSREDVDLFSGLLNKHSKQINIIPGGTKADVWILQKATEEGAKIITNDQYRKEAELFGAKFPWLAHEHENRYTDPKRCRLIPFLFAEGQLQVFDLDICWDLKTGSEVRRASKPEQRKVQHDSGIMLKTADLAKLYGPTADELTHRAAKESLEALVHDALQRERSDNPLSDEEVEQFRKEVEELKKRCRDTTTKMADLRSPVFTEADRVLSMAESRRKPHWYDKPLTKKTWLDKLLGGEL